MPDVLDASDPDAFDEAVRLLRAGEVVAVPTDTVYGVAVDPFQPGAIDRLFAAKDRPATWPYPSSSRPPVTSLRWSRARWTCSPAGSSTASGPVR